MIAKDELALLHDFAYQRGGAERVVAIWRDHWPLAPLHTLFLDSHRTFPSLSAPTVLESSPLQFAKRLPDPRILFPILGLCCKTVPRPAAEVALVSTSGWAHRFPLPPRSVMYFHSPARWLYETNDYFSAQSKLVRRLAARTAPLISSADRRAARRGVIVANSLVTQRRLMKAYGVDARIVHPPVRAVSPTSKPVSIKGDFFLVVARARGYKQVDAIAEAAKRAGVQIVVAGGGGDAAALPTGTVRRVGRVSDAELQWLYANAQAIISASREDFGLTPLEANLAGTPAIVSAAGGHLETVSEGINGTFFAEDDWTELSNTLQNFDRTRFSLAAVRSGAEKFSEEKHFAKISAELQNVREL